MWRDLFAITTKVLCIVSFEKMQPRILFSKTLCDVLFSATSKRATLICSSLSLAQNSRSQQPFSDFRRQRRSSGDLLSVHSGLSQRSTAGSLVSPFSCTPATSRLATSCLLFFRVSLLLPDVIRMLEGCQGRSWCSLPFPFAVVKTCTHYRLFSGFRRSQATTGHPSHDGRWWRSCMMPHVMFHLRS